MLPPLQSNWLSGWSVIMNSCCAFKHHLKPQKCILNLSRDQSFSERSNMPDWLLGKCLLMLHKTSNILISLNHTYRKVCILTLEHFTHFTDHIYIYIYIHTSVFKKFFFTLITKRNNFHLSGSRLSRSSVFDQINANFLLRRVNYLHITTFMCPIVFLYSVSTWMAMEIVFSLPFLISCESQFKAKKSFCSLKWDDNKRHMFVSLRCEEFFIFFKESAVCKVAYTRFTSWWKSDQLAFSALLKLCHVNFHSYLRFVMFFCLRLHGTQAPFLFLPSLETLKCN